jgi:hypothetical protein
MQSFEFELADCLGMPSNSRIKQREDNEIGKSKGSLTLLFVMGHLWLVRQPLWLGMGFLADPLAGHGFPGFSCKELADWPFRGNLLNLT